MRVLNLIVSKLEEIFVSIALITAVTVAFVEVILRQFGSSLGITQELVNYLLIWVGLIGASIGVREKTHLGVDIIIANFEPVVQKTFILLTMVISAIFSIIIAYLGYLHVLNVIEFGQVTPEMEIPLFVPRLLIPIAFGLMSIRFLQESYKVFKTKSRELLEQQNQQLLEKEGVGSE